MSCIAKLLEIKGENNFLPVNDLVVMEGGGNYKDYEYLIVFTHMGIRCGYVALKSHESEAYEATKRELDNEYYLPDIECHGGISFYDNRHAAKALLHIPCKDYWVGFDANHICDLPHLEKSEEYFGLTDEIKYMKEHNLFGFRDSFAAHRSFEYMEKECHGIIDQLLELKSA